MYLSKYTIGILIYLFVNQINIAYSQDLISDRPDQTESALTLPDGYFQLETGTVYEMTPEAQNWIINSTLFRYGVLKGIEMRLVTEISSLQFTGDETSGSLRLADMQAGLKAQIATGSTNAAVIAHAIFPTGDQLLSSGSAGFSVVMCVSRPFFKKLNVGVNAGYRYLDPDNDLALFSCSAGMPLNDKLGFYAEVYGKWFWFSELLMNYDNGFTYLINENLQADFSFGTGLNERFGYYSLGLCWRMK